MIIATFKQNKKITKTITVLVIYSLVAGSVQEDWYIAHSSTYWGQ